MKTKTKKENLEQAVFEINAVIARLDTIAQFDGKWDEMSAVARARLSDASNILAHQASLIKEAE